MTCRTEKPQIQASRTIEVGLPLQMRRSRKVIDRLAQRCVSGRRSSRAIQTEFTGNANRSHRGLYGDNQGRTSNRGREGPIRHLSFDQKRAIAASPRIHTSALRGLTRAPSRG